MIPSDPGSSVPALPSDTPIRDRKRWLHSLIIGICCLLVYNSNGRAISAGDTYPARYIPFAIVKHHTVFMNPVVKVAAQGRGNGAFWILPLPDGHLMSLYPVVLPLIISPLYLPAVAHLQMRGWTDARLDYTARVMEKLSASLLAALSVSLLYLLLRRRTTARTALLLTLAYAFGTTTWVISSQALWQHGLAQVLVIAVLLLLTGPCSVPRALLVGLLCGIIIFNRPPDVILAAVLGTYALFWWGRRRIAMLAIGAGLPAILVLFYNVRFGQNVAGGYGLVGQTTFFSHELFPGIAGLLFSPARGLFIFSPFLLFLALAWRYLPRGRDERHLTLLLTLGVVLQIMLYAKVDWRAGMSWGPRYMTDLMPFLIWMLVPVIEALRGSGRALFLFAAGISVVLEGIGAFFYNGSVDIPLFADDHGANQVMKQVWRWENAPFLTSLKNGVAPRELWVETRGTFDAIEAGGRTTSVVTAGEEAFAAGWALAGHATPWQVAVNIDGQRAFATGTFTDRPDVREALHETSPSGWRIPLDTSGLAPGEHQLTVMVWSSAKGEGHYLDARTLTVRSTAPQGATAPTGAERRAPETVARVADAELDEGFRKATARLREHQQPAGFWLTAYTGETRFQDPHAEMNTFLTSLLVDLLAPLPAGNGLEESVQRARRHLTSQIEPDGLVRYHGLPNGPGIGTLGCAITPDTDNTALVWRIAPAEDRTRLTAALSIIDRYRTRDGLYRTWLAPREAYQCLDPGSDPNPADIAIQMHLLMLESEVRPAAGRKLCTALRPLLDDDRIWVYYRKTPLVPILRLNDLRRAGCDLELPERRMQTDVAGQGIWVFVVRSLVSATRPGGLPPDPAAVRAVLRELAGNDFALLRTNPPLLYHNDLSATVSRYYWSEDAGYALWSRLCVAYEQH